MFPFEFGSSLQHLDQDTRESLVDLLEKKTDYMVHQIELQRLRVNALRQGTPEAQEAVEDYSTTHLRPLRESMMPQISYLLKEAVDIDQLKTILPMALMGLSQAVDIPLLLTVLGLDPDSVADAVGAVQEYFKNGGA